MKKGKSGKGKDDHKRRALYQNAWLGRPYDGTYDDLMTPYGGAMRRGEQILAEQFGFPNYNYTWYLDVVTPLDEISPQRLESDMVRYLDEYREDYGIPDDLCNDNYYMIIQAMRLIEDFIEQEVRLVYYYDVIDYFKYAKGIELDERFKEHMMLRPPEGLIDREAINEAIKKAIQEVRKHPELYERPKLD